MSSDLPSLSPEQQARRRWMGILARADGAAIAARLDAAPPLPAATRLRGPETGLVMARGRQGGDGAPFNLGEMTVTRCSVRDAEGRVGHAYVAGRDQRQAELAARLDAALQDPVRRPALLEAVIEPLAAAQAERAAAMAARAAATKVQFFTMQTMR
ncbi:phosphonate C-P lyase system protein PhnG [Siccirubricoccus sp. KC 17139]|uniref:Phosphonate C-P lyase system protein PhnG n=1 Tax=Siccirubricoccus soli TaxID=2899147 RepID=A0ABT1D687_9PROT|nr:phosphonate C-P lyase system protein PhnG [Siccirubricoccus soli]MCO6417421.1 phosphonate C-P lyase system protein PhnG [Siccirubricoccus soli]MCP2683556.1 phosphonate C-P lyase system protein PhnG [Siccirubricoccus soli]